MRKYIYAIVLLLIVTTMLLSPNNHLADVKVVQENITKEISPHQDNNEHNGMEPLFFVIISLIIGAGVRHFLNKSPIPYTVLLLIVGLILGLSFRMLEFQNSFGISFQNTISWVGNIDPHVILYVFLPTLIFEAAYSMDTHTFKYSLMNALILAIPGILIAIFLTGGLMMSLTYFNIGVPLWTWTVSLMFGAVISANDPVAVVAVLKKLGASKKLGTLIEGESLLNDGTAIVLFMVFFMAITNSASDSSPFIDFFKVGLGGVIIGLSIAYFTINWVKKVFNDGLVEISIIIAAAYLSFFVSEHFFHVSGVLALVAFGLTMAGIGKSRISPEVEHFLHEFWELAAFIANTLIFLIVGIVIAGRVVFTFEDFIVLIIIYVGIHLIRALIIFVFFPLMKNIGYGMSLKDGLVLWWGALRGAVGLALALVVAGVDEQYINAEIKNQFLFYTAGIVTLTLLVNATTITWFVKKLGLTQIKPAKALMLFNAYKYLHQSAENALFKIKKDKFMSKANWTNVKDFLPEIPAHIEKEIEKIDKIETIAETRRLILEKEKASYWHQFKEGLLCAESVRQLSGTIDNILDLGGEVSLSQRQDLEEMWKTSKLWSKLQRIPIIGSITKKIHFEQLAIRYDSAKAFVEAQDEVTKLLDSMYRSVEENDVKTKNNLNLIEQEINENKIIGNTFLRNIKKNMPEIYNAIATRQAIRSLLNFERHTVERLYKNGRIDNEEANKMTEKIEEKMKSLMNTPISISEIETIEVLKEIPFLKNLSPEDFSKTINSFEMLIYAVGDNIIKENSLGDYVMVIARGKVKVSINYETVAILEAGSLVGEISMLTGQTRNASITAETPVTALKISFQKVKELSNQFESIDKDLWQIAGTRLTKDIVKDFDFFKNMPSINFDKWLSKGFVLQPDNEQIIDLKKKIGVLLSGDAYMTNQFKTKISAPAVLDNLEISIDKNSRLFIGDISWMQEGKTDN
jgi:NhaP-type Na+/H+ or K+/H+ antiporter